ncbi:hypothetical protein OAO87_04115 [bacterium]|nr:hypothetical protein [bacterium]
MAGEIERVIEQVSTRGTAFTVAAWRAPPATGRHCLIAPTPRTRFLATRARGVRSSIPQLSILQRDAAMQRW